MIVREFLNFRHTAFDDKPAVHRHFIASALQKLTGQNVVMTEEAVNAVRIDVARAVVVEGQSAQTIPREIERRGESGGSGTDDDAIVELCAHFR